MQKFLSNENVRGKLPRVLSLHNKSLSLPSPCVSICMCFLIELVVLSDAKGIPLILSIELGPF